MTRLGISDSPESTFNNTNNNTNNNLPAEDNTTNGATLPADVLFLLEQLRAVLGEGINMASAPVPQAPPKPLQEKFFEHLHSLYFKLDGSYEKVNELVSDEVGGQLVFDFLHVAAIAGAKIPVSIPSSENIFGMFWRGGSVHVKNSLKFITLRGATNPAYRSCLGWGMKMLRELNVCLTKCLMSDPQNNLIGISPTLFPQSTTATSTVQSVNFEALSINDRNAGAKVFGFGDKLFADANPTGVDNSMDVDVKSPAGMNTTAAPVSESAPFVAQATAVRPPAPASSTNFRAVNTTAAAISESAPFASKASASASAVRPPAPASSTNFRAVNTTAAAISESAPFASKASASAVKPPAPASSTNFRAVNTTAAAISESAPFASKASASAVKPPAPASSTNFRAVNTTAAAISESAPFASKASASAVKPPAPASSTHNLRAVNTTAAESAPFVAQASASAVKPPARSTQKSRFVNTTAEESASAAETPAFSGKHLTFETPPLGRTQPRKSSTKILSSKVSISRTPSKHYQKVLTYDGNEDADGSEAPKVNFAPTSSEGTSVEPEELTDSDTLMSAMAFDSFTATLHSKHDTDLYFEKIAGDDKVACLETTIEYKNATIHPGKKQWMDIVKKQVEKASDILGNKQSLVESIRQGMKDIDAQAEKAKSNERGAAAKEKRVIDAQILQLQAQKQDIDDQLVTKIDKIDQNNAAAKQGMKLDLGIAEAEVNEAKAVTEKKLALPQAYAKVYEKFQVAFDAAIQVAKRTNPTQAEVQDLREKRDELERTQNMIAANDTSAIAHEYFWY